MSQPDNGPPLRVSLFVSRGVSLFSVGVEHIPFLIWHIYAFYLCSLTFGEPYADMIRDLKAEGKIPVDAVDQADINKALENTFVTLPNPYLPGFVPLLIFSCGSFGHILMCLLQVWFVSVLTFVRYKPCKKVSEATFVKVVPQAHRGKTELVPLERSSGPGESDTIFFKFQHHKYIYDAATLRFDRVRSTVHSSLSSYLQSTGLNSRKLEKRLDKFGKNKIFIPQPEFSQLYREQLIQPLTVFQLFCTLLWLLDEYWKYALFSVAMILVFEGVTVFTRMKSLKMIQGMGSAGGKWIYAYRDHAWTNIPVEDLVPGDLVSIKHETGKDDVMPCDGLILKGLCVVNEASLTGESHPQMKEEVPRDDGEYIEKALDMKNEHKVHVLYGGTSVLQHTTTKGHINLSDKSRSPSPSNDESNISTPDGGCLVYVLRTGFNSSQGKLVRMIQFSSQHVRSDSWDALFLVSFLMVFALTASSYVLKKGLENRNRSNFELLLHCTMIITGVVPPELPMQTALAVNTALMALMQLNIFCTEPFRIPTAGKIDLCLFDKTGTITADHLTAVGVIGPNQPASPENTAEDSPRTLLPMLSAPLSTSLVLGGCHSLVSIDGRITGDPVEEAAVSAILFSINPKEGKSYPSKNFLNGTRTNWPAEVREERVEIETIHRNHFASKLQLMSVVARVNDSITNPKIMSLVKGSPEAISNLLLKNDMPPWYWNTYKDLTRRGMRVLALGYKEISVPLNQASKIPRSQVESDLMFAGFVAFRCLVRKDSKSVIEDLLRGSHKIQMVTGDATLTAVYVAKEVGLAKDKEILILEENKKGEPNWVSTDESIVQPFSIDQIQKLTENYCLAVSGSSLQYFRKQGKFCRDIDRITIFARMTPEQKEQIISSMKENGHFCLMCGDGANDVGALKQSHVGVALLSGFGSLNVDKTALQKDLNTSKLPSTTAPLTTSTNTIHKRKKQTKSPKLNPQPNSPKPLPVISTNPIPIVSSNPTPGPPFQPTTGTSQPTLTPEQRRKQIQEELERDIAERVARGESCPWFRAMGAFMKRETSEARRIARERQSQGFAGHAQRLSLDKYLSEMETPGDIMVKLGDASIAAPFTAKTPSIQATVDIIRQGRCALVTTLQMYQILALNCLISAYSLSVLYLDGIKYGDHQMMASGILMTISFLTLSRATPLKELSSVRPLTTIFHPALFLSLIGQFAIHLACMIYSTSITKEYTPDWAPNLTGEFKPSLLNTVVFLISTVQSVSVFVVNYKGRPFMIGMPDNPYLLYSLGACLVGVFLAATEQIPTFNKILQLVSFPNPDFAFTILAILIFNITATFLWDTLMVALFARPILIENLKSIKKEDLRKMFKMVMLLLCAMVLFTPSEEDLQKFKEESWF